MNNTKLEAEIELSIAGWVPQLQTGIKNGFLKCTLFLIKNPDVINCVTVADMEKEAQAFLEWREARSFTILNSNDKSYWIVHTDNGWKKYTTPELYQLYKEQKP